MSSKSLGILYGVLGVVLFSSKAVMVKLAYRYDVDTLDLLLFRMLFSLPFYVFILFLIRKNRQKQQLLPEIMHGSFFWLCRLLFGQLF